MHAGIQEGSWEDWLGAIRGFCCLPKGTDLSVSFSFEHNLKLKSGDESLFPTPIVLRSV
jgi:hypothetical protein